MPLAKIEASQKEINATLKEVGDQLKAHAEKTNKEIQSFGAMGEETRDSVDKLLSQQGALQQRLQAAEQALAANDGSHDPRVVQSLGQRFMALEAAAGLSSSWNGTVKSDFPRSEVAAITTATSGGMVQPDQRGLILPAQRILTIRDLIMPGETESNMINYVVETGFTNNAASAPENTLKAQSGITFAPKNAAVETIAHWIPASKQILDDAKALASFIDGRLRHGLALAEERQLLYGTGTGGDVHGIVPQAQAFAPAITIADATPIDRIRLAILQAMLADYAADGIVLNPTDWAEIELTKDNEGRYIVGNAVNGIAPALWNLPIVQTTSMLAGDFLTGAFGMSAQIFDRETASVQVSTEDRDNFVKNMITIRAEERLAFAVYRPESFVTGKTVGA